MNTKALIAPLVLILVGLIIAVSSAGFLFEELYKSKMDWIEITDTRGQSWKIRKAEATAITPDFTDTNVFRVWLSNKMTICVTPQERDRVEKEIR